MARSWNDGRDLSSGRKSSDEEKKKKKATVTYNRPVVGQDPADRPEGTANVTGVNSKAEAIEAYRADREKTQEKARQEYKSAIKQYQLKTGKTVDGPNAVTAEDRMWYRASNPTDTALSDTTRKIVEARRNTKQKKQELEDYDNQEFDWTDANARKAHEEGRKEKEAAVSQAEQEQNQATAESDRAIIGGLSDEGREKLTEYAKQKDRATGPRRESGSEIEQWFAENQHMNADELGNLAETVIRDKNAAHMEQEQQWARDVADAHPFAASAVTVPANLVSGVASTVGNLGQAIDQKLNGEGHYTGLDPNNEANLLQSMSGAARGEVKGNIVGDGSDPLRAIAGGAYDLGMGILDTKARLALGTITGGGSLVGMGIAGANQFGSAVQDAASRGASTEQALGYAAATSVVDALTEKIPLDNLLSISSAKGGTGRIMQMLSGVLGEGLQETASQLASVFTDAGIMRDKSERNLRVAQMMVQNPGMSLETAQATVDKEILWDMIYNVAIASAGGGFNALLATFERDWANKKGRNAVAQNPQEQPAQEAAEAPDSEKAAPLDGEQMARALAEQAQPAGAADALAAARAQAEAERAAQTQAPTESEAAFDQAFDRVMNQESQTPAQESQAEAPKTDTEMDRRAKMALGMEDEKPIDNGTPKVYDNSNSETGGMNDAGAGQLQGTDGERLPGGNETGRVPGAGDGTLRVPGQAPGGMEAGAEVVPGSVQGKPGGSNTPDDLRVPGELRVSDALTEAQQKKGTPTYPVKDTTTDPGSYEQALTAGRNSDPQNGWCVTPKSAQELKGGNVRTFMDENGTVGVGVAPDGDIVGVFKNKNGGPKKALDTMMPIAIEQGGDRLDCYGEGLVNLYAKYGFEPVARVEFNPEYANEGWTPDKGTPYIYVMKHNGDSADAVVDKMGTYPKYTDAQLNALPTYGKDDYDGAMAYRDSLMQQSQPAAQPEARQEQPAAQSAQQPQTQNTQPVQQPKAQNAQPVQQQAAPQGMPQEAQGGAQRLETNGQAQTPEGYVPGAQASAEGKTMKSKSFTNSGLRGTDNDIRESYKGTLAVDPEAGNYQQLRNMDVMDVARERTSTPERVRSEYEYLMQKDNLTATDVATARLAVKSLFNSGDVDEYTELNQRLAKTATEAGQAVQAFNIGGTMKDAADPESACETAIKGLSGLKKEMTTYNAEKSGKSFEDWRKDVSMGITRLAIAVESVEDGDTAGMQKVITQIAQARNTTGWLGSSDKLTWNARRILKKLDFDDLKKIANTQIASMPDDFRRRKNSEIVLGIRKQNILTSIKSFNRNIAGNAATGLLDSAGDSTTGQAMDMLISKFTGKRTVGNDFTHTKAYIDGAKSAGDFASLCVELNIPIETDVDASYSAVSDGNRLKYGGKTFRSTGNLGMRLLYGYQKYMNYALEVTDKVFEGGSNAAVAESLEGLRNSGLGDEDIDRLSEFTANRRTFKDATWEATDKYGDTGKHGSVVARFSKDAKKGLSGKGTIGPAAEFVVDNVAPFVGTNANVTQTGVDYSTGVMKSIGEFSALIRDAKQGKPIDVNRQRQVASDFGRGVSGIALIGGFTALAAKGIIRVSNSSDKNKKELEQADGLSGAQFNCSAAARESTGGDTKWQNGDVIISVDSLEPFDTHMYLGAELAKEDDIQGMLKALPVATVKSVYNSFMNNPMVTGLNALTEMVSDIGDAVEAEDTTAALGAAAKYAGETASSFIPQIVKQGAKAADGYYRDTRGQTAAEYAKNAFLTNVPGGAQDLPKKISGLGEEQKRGGIYANLFDTTNSQIYQPNAITESLGALSEATGGEYDKEIYPERQAPMKVNNAAGEAVELDGAQRETYQREYGGKVSEYYTALMNNPDYQKLTDELKAEALKTVKGYAADYARAAVTDYKEVKTGTAVEIGKEAVMDVVTKQMASGINDMQKAWDYGYDEKPAKETLESAYDTYSKMTDSQKAAYKENVSGDTAKYLEAREAGVSTTAYLKVLDAVKHADGTGNSAKYRAITSASISESAMDKLMKAYMPDYDPDKPKSDKTELKYDYARKELGMTPAEYAKAYEIYTSKSDELHGKKQKMAKWTELYGADVAKQLWKLYGGKLDVVDWWEDQQ
nr:MAG TPA: hypothetical protein [Caudoviricetes sp.]